MTLYTNDNLRERRHVFADRRDAGRALAEMLSLHGVDAAGVVGIVAGGMPVAAPVAEALNLPLWPAVVSKITPPFNTEIGYGAVAFDGSVALDRDRVLALSLSDLTVERGVDATRQKVERRVAAMGRPQFSPGDRLIVVDDGLASGFTMKHTLAALESAGAGPLVVAVPTAHPTALRQLEPMVEAIHCANVRSDRPYAVAEAYAAWRDVTENEVAGLLTLAPHRRSG